MPLHRVTSPRIIPKPCAMTPIGAALFWNASLPVVGASRMISKARPYSWLLRQPITYTGRCLPWMADGWGGSALPIQPFVFDESHDTVRDEVADALTAPYGFSDERG